MSRLRKGIVSASWALLLSCVLLPAHAQTVVKLGTVAPEQSVWHDALLRIAQDWRDISSGNVELRVYAGGVLGGEDEMVRKMQRRGLDALAISSAGLPLIDQIVSCLSLPMLFESYEELESIRHVVAPRIEAAIESRGYKVLGWAEAGWVHFFAKEPVRVPADLRQQRVWTSTGSPEHEALLNEFGFRVVALPAPDMLTGLQTGLIDAIDVPPLFALADRSYQTASNMTDLRFAPLNSAVVVNLSVWERLPAEYHSRFLASVERAVGALREQTRAAEQQAIEEMVARGLNVIELAPAEIAEWEALAESAYPELPCSREYPELFRQILDMQERGASR
jgi:TRAP-type C4-dicarboxylate transport system substrate-binding protein